MADDQPINQEEIERLLNQTSEGASGGPPATGDPPPEAGAEWGEEEGDSGESQTTQASQPTQAQQASQSPQADNDEPLGEENVEKLPDQAGKTPTAREAQATGKRSAGTHLAGEGEMAGQDVEYLLNQAEEALQSVGKGQDDGLPDGVTSFRLEEFSGAPASSESATLDLIRDVELDLTIELGRTHMYLEDVLKLRQGSVVPLEKLAGDPVDIYVNERLIARGEVLVLNDNFCVRVAELISGGNV